MIAPFARTNAFLAAFATVCSLGKRVSSGCIRMLDRHVTDLYARVSVGIKVVVLPIKQFSPTAKNALAYAPSSNRGNRTYGAKR
jgi:hypothetical protein